MDELPAADPAIRAQIDVEAGECGWPAMHARLAQLDPPTAARLDPNDSQRIQRALEVMRLSGQPLSALLGSAVASDLKLRIVALLPSDRKALHARIAWRFDAMLAAGLVDELRRLREQYELHRDLPSMRSVGYRQAWEFLEHETDAEGLRERGIAATRQLAKHQLTWLRGMPELAVFDCLEQELETSVAEFAQNQMHG
jgi:tRNA dimethylallyltransferase